MQNNFGIRELAEQAKRDGAYDLAQGIIDTRPPEALVAAMRELPLDEYSTYNNKRGVPEYREAVREYLAGRGWPVVTAQVLATSGITGGLAAALLTDLRPKAKVLLPEPFFIGHKLQLETLGFETMFWKIPVETPSDSPLSGGESAWEKLADKMAEVDAVILTHPHNPTGQVVPAQVRGQLAEAAAQHNCLLLLDEMYRDFIWDEEVADDSPYTELNLEKTVVLRGFSKSLAIPGWRVGFAVTSPERVEKMAGTHDSLYLGGSTLSQNAMAHALHHTQEALAQYVADLRAMLLRNRDLLAAAFTQAGYEPFTAAATYYMPLKHIAASDMAAMEELVAKKIVVTPLSILTSTPETATGYIRIHFGVSEETARAVAEILS